MTQARGSIEGEASSIQLTGSVREHLEGALMLFAAERWQTYAADPERTYRALTAPGATTLVAKETMA